MMERVSDVRVCGFVWFFSCDGKQKSHCRSEENLASQVTCKHLLQWLTVVGRVHDERYDRNVVRGKRDGYKSYFFVRWIFHIANRCTQTILSSYSLNVPVFRNVMAAVEATRFKDKLKTNTETDKIIPLARTFPSSEGCQKVQNNLR